MGSDSSSSKGESSDNKDQSSHSDKSYSNSGNTNSNSKEESLSNEAYNSNSSSKILRASTSIAIDFVPVVGNVKAICESIGGKDLITGYKLSPSERILTACSALIPGGSGVKNVGKVSLKIAKNSGNAEKIVKNATKIEKEVKAIKNVEKEINSLNKTKTFTKEENIKFYTEKMGYPRSEIGGSGKPKFYNVKCKDAKDAKEKAKNVSSHNKPPIKHSAHYDKETGKKKIGNHYHPSDNKGSPKKVHYVYEDE